MVLSFNLNPKDTLDSGDVISGDVMTNKQVLL